MKKNLTSAPDINVHYTICHYNLAQTGEALINLFNLIKSVPGRPCYTFLF